MYSGTESKVYVYRITLAFPQIKPHILTGKLNICRYLYQKPLSQVI